MALLPDARSSDPLPEVPKIGPLMDHGKAEVLAFAAFPRTHWVKVWSTNPLERVNKEIKGRARAVGMHDESRSRVRAAHPFGHRC